MSSRRSGSGFGVETPVIVNERAKVDGTNMVKRVESFQDQQHNGCSSGCETVRKEWSRVRLEMSEMLMGMSASIESMATSLQGGVASGSGSELVSEETQGVVDEESEESEGLGGSGAETEAEEVSQSDKLGVSAKLEEGARRGRKRVRSKYVQGMKPAKKRLKSEKAEGSSQATEVVGEGGSQDEALSVLRERSKWYRKAALQGYKLVPMGDSDCSDSEEVGSQSGSEAGVGGGGNGDFFGMDADADGIMSLEEAKRNFFGSCL